MGSKAFNFDWYCACVCKCLHFEFRAENTSKKAIQKFKTSIIRYLHVYEDIEDQDDDIKTQCHLVRVILYTLIQ